MDNKAWPGGPYFNSIMAHIAVPVMQRDSDEVVDVFCLFYLSVS